MVLVGYMTHAVFTFRARASATALGAYATACLINLPLALAAMYVFCTVLQLPVGIGAPLTSGVMLVFNYVAARLTIGHSGARSNTLQT